MYIKIKNADIFGISYPKENLIKLFDINFKEIEKHNRVTKHLYVSEMMYDFITENLNEDYLTKDSDGNISLWTAQMHKSKRCYDAYISDEELESSIWDCLVKNGVE